MFWYAFRRPGFATLEIDTTQAWMELGRHVCRGVGTAVKTDAEGLLNRGDCLALRGREQKQRAGLGCRTGGGRRFGFDPLSALHFVLSFLVF